MNIAQKLAGSIDTLSPGPVVLVKSTERVGVRTNIPVAIIGGMADNNDSIENKATRQ